MSHKDGRASARGRPERHRDIVDAALRCFTRKGYNNTTMDDIVEESGLSKGTLYWYFDGKEDLFQAALLSVFDGFEEGVLARMDCCETATEKLRHLGAGAADFGDSVGAYFSLFLEFWVSRPQRDDANKVWYNLLEEYQAVLTGIVEEGIAGGEFRRVDAESLVWSLMATYDGLAAYGAFIPDLDLGSISRTFTDVMLKGLARPAQAAPERGAPERDNYTKKATTADSDSGPDGSSRAR